MALPGAAAAGLVAEAALRAGKHNMKFKKFINEQERKAIEAAVHEAEANTSGEIVPAVVDSSSDYHWVAYRGAFLGWLVASLALVVIHFRYPFALSFGSIFAYQAAGIVLAWLFSRTRLGFWLLVSDGVMEEEVSESAQAAFFKHGLVNTRDRTGVLIFVSLKEHRVQIVGDKGIHEKVGEGFWKAETDIIVKAIREGKPAGGLIQAIRDIGEKLHAHFPKRAGDTNELTNVLRTE